MTVRCPICYDTFEGDVIDDAPDIAPGDQLVDHLTDAHNPRNQNTAYSHPQHRSEGALNAQSASLAGWAAEQACKAGLQDRPARSPVATKGVA